MPNSIELRDSIELKDSISKNVLRAIDILFIYNPKGTSFGFFLGFAIKNILDLLLLYLLNKNFTISYWICIPLLICIVNIPSLRRKHKIDEGIESLLYYLQDIQRKGNFSEDEKRQQWRNLIELLLTKSFHDNKIETVASAAASITGEKD